MTDTYINVSLKIYLRVFLNSIPVLFSSSTEVETFNFKVRLRTLPTRTSSCDLRKLLKVSVPQFP